MARIAFSFVSLLLWLGSALGVRTPLQNLQVTLRGKKYEISDVATVDELKAKMKEASGNTKDHHVLFDGKRLAAAADLAEEGVEDGSQLNMVPALSKKKTTATSSTTPADGVRTTTTTESMADTQNAMKEYLKNAGVDTNQLDELMKQMGAGGAGAGGAPDLDQSLKMMTDMMNSPMFQRYMNDPEMLEQTRQMILNNPMLKNMMASMPGMEQILQDPEVWRETMQQAAQMYKELDPEQLKAMMDMTGAMGGGGAPGGLFDGGAGSPPSSSAALDELDED